MNSFTIFIMMKGFLTMYQPPNQGYPNQPPYQGPPSQPGMPYQQQPQGYPPNPQQPYQQPFQQQPAPQPPKKKANKVAIGCIGAIVLVVIIIIAAAAGSHGSSPNAGTTTGTNSNPTTSTTSQHFKVGDAVTVGSTWKAVVNSVKTDDGGQFSSALKAGDTYLVVNISLTNLSSQEQNVSSELNFTLQDSTGQKYTEGIDPNAGATLDGKVSAGSPLRGVIVYEVSASMKSFVLNFAPDLISSGQTTWDLNL
jgi:hypothetical protein